MRERLKERLRAAFTRDDGTRLIASLVLATMLWGWVSLVTDPDVTQVFGNLAIQHDPLGPALLLVTQLSPVTVRLTGPESVIEDVSTSEIVVSIDTSSIDRPGSYTLPIRVEAPDGVRKMETLPPTVSVDVEETLAADFPLQSRLVDLPESDPRRVGQLQPQVSEVTVSGPKNDVERVAEVVLPIEVGTRTQEFTGSFEPQALDAAGNPVPEVTIAPQRISVTVPLTQRGRSVAVLAAVEGTPADGYEVVDRRINPSSVLVDGPPDVLSSSITVLTEPVDITAAMHNVTLRVPLDLESLPEGVTVIQPADGTVEVVVQIDLRGVNQSLPDQRVVPVGLAEGIAVTIEPASVAVTVVATESQLQSLAANDIRISVDVAQLGLGTYTVTPNVSVPANMRWVQVDPPDVTVTIALAASTPATPDASPAASPRAGAVGVVPAMRRAARSRQAPWTPSRKRVTGRRRSRLARLSPDLDRRHLTERSHRSRSRSWT